MCEVKVLHFNDVYDLESRSSGEPAGGVARFATVLKKFYDSEKPLLLFGGDALSPSMISNFTKGKHMAEIFNDLKVDVAVVGNHDFDFGVDNLCEVMEECHFPWLLANVIDNYTDGTLANAPTDCILHSQGIKIGVIGLVEPEWLATLSTVDEDDVTILDFIDKGRELAIFLKSQGCKCVIALTHMRWPNSVKIAENVDEIDLVLGGHDHFYKVEKINGKWNVVSGSDFQYLTELTLQFDENQNLLNVDLKTHEVTSSVPEDPSMATVVQKYLADIVAQLDNPIGSFEVDLDGRFSSIRSQESNLGNWICDTVVSALSSDCCLLNSGTFRSDRIHPAGEFTIRDLQSILPFLDPIVVLLVKGKDILAALENGVSQYPKLEGRFPQVSGIQFAFDPRKNPGERIHPKMVIVNEEPLDLDREYRLCTKSYLADGKDGYDVFADCKKEIDVENSQMLSTIILNAFQSLQILRGLKKSKSSHRQNLLSRRSSSVRRISMDMTSFANAKTRRASTMLRRQSIQNVEAVHAMAIQHPHLEGRIRKIESDEEEQMLVAHFGRTNVKTCAIIEEDEEEEEDIAMESMGERMEENKRRIRNVKSFWMTRLVIRGEILDTHAKPH